MARSYTAEPDAWNPTAALLAWLVPGLGHSLLGERRRGAIIGVTITTLLAAGLLIGGVGVIDRKDHPAWFAAQACAAPSVVAGEYFQRLRRADPTPLPGQNPAFEPAYGKVQEQGTLYTALAGLLNLLAVVDVLHRDPKRRRLDSPGNAPPTSIDLGASRAIAPLPLLLLAALPPGYRPFLDPLPLDTYWLLLLPPLAIAVAVVYKTVRVDDLRQLPRQATLFAAQIIVFMVLAAMGVWLVTELRAHLP